MFQKLIDKLNCDDFLTAVALFGFIYIVCRQTSVDPTSYGTGITAIFTGHAIRSYGNSKEPPKP